jgi:hypothetical protein
MANGRLGAVKPAANTAVELYVSPALTLGTATVSICNQGDLADYVYVAVCSGGLGTLADTDYIEHKLEIPPHQAAERTAVATFGGQGIIVKSQNGTSSFVAYGLEG